MNKKQIVANTLRMLSCQMIENAQSGHPGMPLGFADAMVALLYELNFDYKNPEWVNRDRVIFSCGHGCALWYSVLYGFGLRSLEDLSKFRQLGSNTPGHLEHGPGIDMTTGPLGMGFSWAVGMALAERILNHNHKEIDHHTYIICSDGDLMEGVSYEAAAIAGQYNLNKIIALWDDNSITIDGPTDISRNENIRMRFSSQNWNVIEVDGNNIEKVQQAICIAKTQDKPTLIACKTTIGKYSQLEGTSKVHGAPLGPEIFEKLKIALNYNEDIFLKEFLKEFENIKKNARVNSDEWHMKYKNEDFIRRINFIPQNEEDQENLKKMLANNYATRLHSQNILEMLINNNDNIIIASADLSTSCGTKPKSGKLIQANDFSGNLLPCGVRENAMVAIVGGLTMHSKLQGIASTFLAFTDYARPAIRLSALMNIPIIVIATHDSIALGEDGPTHQPIEHLDSLRCIPNLLVARPADGFETFYCYENILAHSVYDFSLLENLSYNINSSSNNDINDLKKLYNFFFAHNYSQIINKWLNSNDDCTFDQFLNPELKISQDNALENILNDKKAEINKDLNSNDQDQINLKNILANKDNKNVLYKLNNFILEKGLPNYHAKPAILVLTRQNLETVHKDFIKSENLEFFNEYEKNGYIISCGSELSLSLELGKYLKKMVISMPFFVKKEITSNSIHIIEASSCMCWRYLFPNSKLFNITHFGASGKQSDLLKKYGFTFENLLKWLES